MRVGAGTGNSTPHLPEDYNLQVRRTIPHYDTMHSETINLARALDRPPRFWLDTGCGTGAMVEQALRLLPDTEFILADPSQRMLDVARGRFHREGRVGILRPMRTQDLAGELGETPDLITAVQCHHYLARRDREKAVEVCFGLLPKDGAFISFENVRPFTAAGIKIGKRNWGNFQKRNGKDEAEAEAHLARFDREYFPITAEEHLDILQRTGFSSVELLWYSHMQAGFFCIR